MKKLKTILEQANAMFEVKTRIEDEKEIQWVCFTNKAMEDKTPMQQEFSRIIHQVASSMDDGYNGVSGCLETLLDQFEYREEMGDTVEEFFEWFEENRDELIDGYVDVYTYDLLKWLSKNLNRVARVEEALKEQIGDRISLSNAIMRGQAMEYYDIWVEVINLIKETREEMGEDEEELTEEE